MSAVATAPTSASKRPASCVASVAPARSPTRRWQSSRTVSARSAPPPCSRKDDDVVKLISFTRATGDGFGAVLGPETREPEIVDLTGVAGATTLPGLLAAGA